jgi:peptide/nickel transport system substrate-binding protein
MDRSPRLSRRDFARITAGAAALAATPGTASARQPRRGGVIKHVGIEPSSFDIHATAASPTQLMSSFVRRTLFKVVQGPRYGPSDFTLAPDLALRADVSRDGTVYTIALRPGVRWESRPPLNGRELTSADVKYSLDRAVRKSGHATLLGPIEGVETPDRHTVRVRLGRVHAPFMHNLAEPCHAILPREVEDRFGDFKSAGSMLGCGPFVLDRYEPGVKAVFVRNPAYHDKALPYVDRVEWVFLRDRSTQLALFRAGQVDVPFHDGRIPRADIASFRKSNPTYPIVFWPCLGMRPLAMRTDRAPFNDVRVRRAFSLALDRKSWVARYPEGQGYEDHGPVPAAMGEWKLPTRDYGEGARWLEHDPRLARKFLADAGFPNGMRVRCAGPAGDSPGHAEELDLLASSLRQIGVELAFVNGESGDPTRGSSLGKFDEVRWGPSSFFTEVDGYLTTFFRTGEPNNRSHVSDPRLDAMLDAQRRSQSRSSRKKIIDAIQQDVTDRVLYVYPPSPKQVSSWNPRLRNYAPKNSYDKGGQLEVVWLDS